jgi:hypothetical protein
MTMCDDPEDDLPEYFELMIARFMAEPTTEECRVESLEELDVRLAPVLSEPILTIGLNRVIDDADWGHFLLLLNGDRAWIHLVDGPCLTGRDPNLRASAAQPVMFQDDAGVWHEVPYDGTLSREQGLAALRHWAPRGEKSAELAWSKC